ncbi:MAG TPA: hypothetical protein VFK70_19550 [Vicinamibacteria bacterium]|nr:hypothetical protein [Vicinamibacteria bacterium]
MKLVAAGIALLLLGSVSADAGIFGKFRRKADLPKPIDAPVVRPKFRDDHKAGKRVGRHPQAFQRSEYGAEWKKIFATRHHPIPEYLYQAQ